MLEIINDGINVAASKHIFIWDLEVLEFPTAKFQINLSMIRVIEHEIALENANQKEIKFHFGENSVKE